MRQFDANLQNESRLSDAVLIAARELRWNFDLTSEPDAVSMVESVIASLSRELSKARNAS